MDLFELKLFLHLSESLHFGLTGRECNISPSALSRMIRRIEEEIGNPVFERDTRSVRLTCAGRKLKIFATETLEKWQDLTASLNSDDKNLSGELCLYSSVTACYGILPDILSSFRTTYPGVHIKLKTGDAAQAIAMVSGGNADIAVAALPPVLSEQLLFSRLIITPLIFIGPSISCTVSEMLRNPDRIMWQDIPMIVPEQGLARDRLDDWFGKKGIIPSLYAQVSGNEAILAMVTLGCGAGIVPEMVLEKSPLKSGLIRIRVEPELEPYTVGICIRKKKKDSPLVHAFWKMCQGSV